MEHKQLPGLTVPIPERLLRISMYTLDTTISVT